MRPYGGLPERRARNRSHVLVCTAAFVALCVCDAARSHERLTLGGGLFHSAGFIASGSVGGQSFRLQVDISQGALTLPAVGCTTCRVGDRRYNVSKSTTGGRPVRCDESPCAGGVCSKSVPGTCPICTSGGACCVDMNNVLPKRRNSMFRPQPKGLQCTFNLEFSKNMDANGTMFIDTVQVGSAIMRNVVFGGMREETLHYEMAYADGILGLGFDVVGHPSVTPPFMDYFANATGLPNVFTMCVTPFGGTLSLGAADSDLAMEPFSYVPLQSGKATNHYLVEVQSYGRVGNTKVQLPELATGVWSSATTAIAVGKTTFLTILEVLVENYCHIPGLCGVNSWFRPEKCVVLSDESVEAMPKITFYLSADVAIVMEPQDYLIPYKKVDGHQMRCVAFLVADLLATRGIGILFGSSVMRRHAVVFDREKRRVGLAKAAVSQCGPTTGSTAGLMPSTSGGLRNVTDDNILTPSTPRAKPSGAAGSTLQESLAEEETCRAIDGCSGCSRNSNCSFSYSNGRCVSRARAGTQPYPFCTGFSCVCIIVGITGWYVGIVTGVILALSCSGCCFGVYLKRKRKQRYQSVVPYEAAEHEVETF